MPYPPRIVYTQRDTAATKHLLCGQPPLQKKLKKYLDHESFDRLRITLHESCPREGGDTRKKRLKTRYPQIAQIYADRRGDPRDRPKHFFTAKTPFDKLRAGKARKGKKKRIWATEDTEEREKRNGCRLVPL